MTTVPGRERAPTWMKFGTTPFETWGIDQANAYLTQVFATIEQLARNPQLGRDVSAIRPGYRQHPSGKHVIFYRWIPRFSISCACCTNACLLSSTSSSR